MTYRVKEITSLLTDPIVAYPHESLNDAMSRMLKHEFDQLPVIVEGKNGRIDYYLITKDSILNTLAGFGSSLKENSLHVSDAMINIQKYSDGDELFDLISGMKNFGAALIVSEEGRLLHIVTSYDTTCFLKQISEDIMYVRDIEHTIKDVILECFRLPDGSLDGENLQKAVNEAISEEDELKKRFFRALKRYLNKTQKDLDNPKKPIIPDPKDVEDAYREMQNDMGKVKVFSDLTLDGYIRLFFHENCWSKFGHVIGQDKQSLIFILEGIRETRNKLAHFREDEITPQQREQLHTCEKWLGDHKKVVFTELQSKLKM